MKQHWQQAGHKVKPGLKIAGKLVLLTALRFGPAGVAGWAIKSVARKPIRMVLAVALEPLLQKVALSLTGEGLATVNRISSFPRSFFAAAHNIALSCFAITFFSFLVR